MPRESRVIIENVNPQVDNGLFPTKRVESEETVVTADIFSDGHQIIDADLLWKCEEEKKWRRIPMRALGNDRWTGTFILNQPGRTLFTIEAWIDHYGSWASEIKKKTAEDVATKVDISFGIEILNQLASRSMKNARDKINKAIELAKKEKDVKKQAAIMCGEEILQLARACPDPESVKRFQEECAVVYSRRKAGFSTWYELFPRSAGPDTSRSGTFADCIALLPDIAAMGFDVLYLPPIHPIGEKNRKGKNNSVKAEKEDVGSPWAIGSKLGGHDAIHPDLGTTDDLQRLIKTAKNEGIEIALDLAFQCAPDHPYVKKHPQWFAWRPDGTIQYAENPPKKYEDIVPFDFETDDWENLWKELLRVVLYWVDLGIKIFRVDNPHTKPFAFWKWLIAEVKKRDSDVLFLSEAFTRPRVMEYLAKIGFDQSYTYFTWRQTKSELEEYLRTLIESPVRDYYRPNFWPNTPDILPQHLQYGGRPAFIARLVLAATLSSNYGIYGPAYENCISKGIEGKEEYHDSEKYQRYCWQRKDKEGIAEVVALVNKIRNENDEFQTTWNLEFVSNSNEHLISYLKGPGFLIVVNLDYHYTQSGMVRLPISTLGIEADSPYLVHDLLTGDKYVWEGEENYVELNPRRCPAHIFKIHPRVKHEEDFDYFM